VIKKTKMTIINSETLPGNLLPNFLFQQGSIEGGSVGVKIGGGKGTPKPFSPDDSCGDDIFDGAMTDMRSPQLPYLTQDLWTCDRKIEDIDVWIMENEYLKVTVTPQYAGKVWGIYDKKRKQELLYHNRAHQPANIGALKSWAAGGAEWNWSPGIIGHSAFSETRVFLGSLTTELGPVLRVYEYDRYNGTVWQVDMLLMNDSFIAHPRIVNPTTAELRGYWWTCVAVHSDPSTRILTPATHVAETSRDPMRTSSWPYFAEAIENASFTGYKDQWPTDNSYLGNHQIGDMFLRIPKDAVYTPYIAHNQEGDGFVLVHGHPLNGTKFFTWGQSGPGRFMQDFLAGGGKRQGDYTELQVGPAPTQMQNFPLPSLSELQWTEWFKGFQADENIIRGDDYDAALHVVEKWIMSSEGMPKSEIALLDSFFETIVNIPVDEILVAGQPWGALEEILLGHNLNKGLTFTLPSKGTIEYDEMLPWLELLQNGTFSEQTTSKLPISYQTTDGWFQKVKESSLTGMTWLHALHLAIGHIERGDIDYPKLLLKQSMELFPNPIAARCLAVLSSTADEAWPHYELAWSLSQTSFLKDPAYHRLTLNLITEISFFLQQQLWYDEMESFSNVVNQGGFMSEYKVDAFLTLQIKLMLNKHQFTQAIELLSSNCFPTYAKARDDLMSMWNLAQQGIAQNNKGRPLTNVELHQVRINHPVPDNIGCQYASEYCTNYW